MASKSTKSPQSLKPYKTFPLTVHKGAGQWCKKLKRPEDQKTRTFYFGPLGDWKAALKRYEREWPYRVEGRTPPVETSDDDGACTLRTLCNTFLQSKRSKITAGELTDRSYRDYYRTCERLIRHFGTTRRVDDLLPAEFESLRSKLAEKLSAVSLLNEINRCRVLLKYASDQRLIATPVHFGQSFDRPSRKVLRKVRNDAGAKVFTRDELLTILSALDGEPVSVEGVATPVKLRPNPTLRAMVLLGLNGGLGNSDCANLRESHLDLAGGWLDYPRPKTEVPRRIPLWPESVAALKAALTSRQTPRDPDDAGIVFLTRTRRRFVRMKATDKPEQVLPLDMVSKAFGKLLKSLHINGRRNLGFYTLRRQFEIVGGESKDQVSVDFLMGHTDDSMAGVYRQNQISDERLRAVTDHVREWLWPKRK